MRKIFKSHQNTFEHAAYVSIEVGLGVITFWILSAAYKRGDTIMCRNAVATGVLLPIFMLDAARRTLQPSDPLNTVTTVYNGFICGSLFVVGTDMTCRVLGAILFPSSSMRP